MPPISAVAFPLGMVSLYPLVVGLFHFSTRRRFYSGMLYFLEGQESTGFNEREIMRQSIVYTARYLVHRRRAKTNNKKLRK